MAVKFIIITTQRSGSNFLRSVITGNPQIRSMNEVLIERTWSDGSSPYAFQLKRIRENPENITYSRMKEGFSEYLDYIFTPQGQETAVGFDVKYDQVPHFPYLFEQLHSKGVKVIHLIRENILRTLLSAEIRWALREEEKRRGKRFGLAEELPFVTMRLECDRSLIQAIETRKAEIEYHRKTLASAFPYLEITYESFFDQGVQNAKTIAPKVLDSIYDFLDVKERTYGMETSYVKALPKAAEDYIENFAEVRQFLSAAGYGDFVREGV